MRTVPDDIRHRFSQLRVAAANGDSDYPEIPSAAALDLAERAALHLADRFPGRVGFASYFDMEEPAVRVECHAAPDWRRTVALLTVRDASIGALAIHDDSDEVPIETVETLGEWLAPLVPQ